jgi:hypothetical protein
MKKIYSSEKPNSVVANPPRYILNYNVYKTSEEELNQLWKERFDETAEMPSTPDDWFREQNKYGFNQVTIPMGRWNYQGIVEAIIRDKYTADEMEAITNNMNAVTGEFFNVLVADGILSATKYLLGSINDENTKNFKEMQEWRINAKKIAKEIIK